MLSWLTAEVSPRPLGLARVIVGGASVIRALHAWPTLRGLTQPDVINIPYTDWLPEPSMALAIAIVILWLVAAALFTIGWRVAITGPVLLAAIVASLVVDQQTYGNHVYLMAWIVFLLTLADSGAGLSVSSEDRPIVRWPVLLLMAQLSVVYGFSGITKLNEFFLSGATMAAVLRDGVIPFPESLRIPEFLSVLAPAVVFVELFIAVMIWRPSFRSAAFVLGIGLHVSITLLMAPTTQLLVFSLEMLALYPLFLGDAPLNVAAPESSGWKGRINRFDLLRVVDFSGTADALTLSHRDRTTHGAAAHSRILEHLIPWLWIAPMLRVPGVRKVHARWFSSRAPL